MTLKTLAGWLRGGEDMAALLLYTVREILAQTANRTSPPPPGRIKRATLPNPAPRRVPGTTRKENMMIPNDIDLKAPVIARRSAEISAPLDVLWRLHTDVGAWPDWQPDIERARPDGPFAPGSTFSWHAGGLDIESTIYRVEDERHTLWGGPAHGIVGVHSWTFTPVGDGVVRVDTAESWSGEPIEANVAAMQEALDGSLVAWLGHLETAATGSR